MAANNRYDPTVCLLIQQNASINIKGANGSSSLSLTAKNGHTDIVTRLLGRGASVASVDHKGRTSLILAVKNGHDEVVRIVLNYGADVNAKIIGSRQRLSKLSWKGKSRSLEY